MSGNKWSAADVPDQSGRTAIVTGANTGIGYEAASVLADRGAHVVLAVRDLEKGKAALARIMGVSPRADVTVQQLDLTSLDSIRTAATKDGFELQFGTNRLGHFALTGLLLDHLLPVAGSRVVTISSQGHRIRAGIHFQGGQYYGPGGPGELRGHPKVVQSSKQSHDEHLQQRLWSVSEEPTAVTFPV
ncbi:MAG: putative dehydrogenase/reductase [Mycobacterium sp.]|jgi:NAD(P)-dependent dehydrogenase (short-subunit alcohol dehydrogenase family)|nr:putative dehydrogenase/reductase [Mycobacterium sp.]